MVLDDNEVCAGNEAVKGVTGGELAAHGIGFNAAHLGDHIDDLFARLFDELPEGQLGLAGLERVGPGG